MSNCKFNSKNLTLFVCVYMFADSNFMSINCRAFVSSKYWFKLQR